MLGLLVKKQLTEVFRMYFYDAKKNQKRSKGAIVAWFLFYAAIMLGVLGGMFTYLAAGICGPLGEVGMSWLYFLLFIGISIVLGAFGSVFNTFSGLYLSKDNDLLLSMPIPVKYIIASRLINVYILGAMYSIVVILPGLIVYWVKFGVTAGKLLAGLAIILMITLFVLILSCLLGWCVAKVSSKLKNKSFITVLLSLAFIAAYYLVYFKAQELITDLIANAVIYGDIIKDSAYPLYLLGMVPCADAKAILIYLGAVLALLLITWLILKNTFLSIATSSGATAKKTYKAKAVKTASPFKALLSKEFAKFTSSPNYMLNCGLGILLIPALGVFILIKGKDFASTLGEVFGSVGGAIPVLLTAAIIVLVSMIDVGAPSVSLEGKNIWIPQSLPVSGKDVLRAKFVEHLLLCLIPMIFTTVCAIAVFGFSVEINLLLVVFAFVYSAFYALFCTFLGTKMPNLVWTNELYPIKQSGAVAIALFGGWGIAAVFALPYMLIAWTVMSAWMYLAIWIVVFAALSAIMLRWLDTRGAQKFAEL